MYCEFYNANFHYDPGAYATMIRTATHKLVRYHGSEFGELYDLSADPNETHNLWNSPVHAALRTDLLVRLTDRMAETCDPLPVRTAVW